MLPLLSQLTVTTEKLWGKNGTERGLKNQQKNDNIEFRKKKNDKMEIKFEIKKYLEVKIKINKIFKNFKVITIYLIIVTVIIEIMVKMIVILINKDNNR